MNVSFPVWNDVLVIELSDVHAFLRVVETSSVSAAARSLSAPKSSVSRSIARLEASVGATLFERASRGLSPTEAGTLFRQHAVRILAGIEEAEAAIGNLAGPPRGTLRVSAPFAVAAALVAPMLPAFVARYPEVRVVLDSDNHNVDLVGRAADLALRMGKLRDSDLVARRLPPIAMWLCASPAYLSARGTPKRVSDLAKHDVLGRMNELEEWVLERKGQIADRVTVQPRVMVSDPAAAVRVVEGGVGIGRLPSFVADEPLARGTLARVLPRFESLVPAHALYPSQRSLSAKTHVFIDALVAHLTR